jgi:hypothetical protein
MQHYNKNSAKGTWLYSNKEWIADIDKYATTPNNDLGGKPSKLVSVRPNAQGDVKVYGNKAELKGSQSYTRDFGKAVQQLLDEHRDDIREDVLCLRAEARAAGPFTAPALPKAQRDFWASSGIPDVIDYLMS